MKVVRYEESTIGLCLKKAVDRSVEIPLKPSSSIDLDSIKEFNQGLVELLCLLFKSSSSKDGEYLVSPSCQWLINGSNVIVNSVFSNPIDIGLSPIAHYRSLDYLVANHQVPENMVLAGLSESLAEPHALFCFQILKQILGAVVYCRAYCPAKLPMVISGSLQFGST